MVQPWTFSGYQGFRTRGLQWGERPDSTIVRLSSDEARWNWWEFYELSENVTRVDWQVTHRAALSPFKRVLAHHRQARKYWRKRRDGPTITMITDDRQGATLYLGKRSSRLLLRCYNKHAESMDQRYEGCVRYEVEMKGELGKFMMLKLSSGIDPLPGIVSQVHQMFHERGVVPEFAKEVLPFACEWSRKATDVDRKRLWLRNQVQPTVSFLIGRLGMAAVAEDLGLSEFASASHNYYQPWTRRSNNQEAR
jgi:DNA relaxase NicK